ncbi:hypothetical protein IQ250_14775 [Pseudanabaenaceae cyanobacterium LEGE 13415]|nr:hypothetical protein [Pseudanabaenaceae cyanobacterium LEGE 13415]
MSQPDANSPTESPSSVTQSQATATKFLAKLRTGTIGTLRSTSRFLENIANRVEASEEPNPILLKVATVGTIALERVSPLWKKLLTVIRDRLPGDLSRKFGDRALSGIVISAIVVLFWFTSSLFSSKPAQPVQVATRPPVIIPDQPTQFPTDLSVPEAAPEIVSAPIEEPVAEVPIEEPVIEEPVAVIPVEEPTLEEPVAEVPAESLPVIEPEPELTPEQKQLAAIQAQVTEVSDQFIGGLVTSVEPQVDRARLTVRVSEDWYRFSAEQQDRFADELWEKAQSIELPKLRITDAQGTLIARPAIVGETMVILKRKS